MRASLLVFVAGCTAASIDPERPADFAVRAGVEVATVLDALPGESLTLYRDGDPQITLLADELGQAHFAYVGDELLVLDTSDGMMLPVIDGGVLEPGDYTIESDDADRWSGPVHVRAIDEVPYALFYEQQELVGVATSPLTGELDDPEVGYQYIAMRDGTLLSAMVRLPDPALFGDGPYPTVIEYSGYSPSRPDELGSGLLIANALGYASVGVNMRGTGCSGGVFDVFNRAQHADGYDIVEVVARQEWVLHGQVGMVGVSYPAISQLYTASTAPPGLAAIAPVSVIADAWEMQWPGGIYNEGFTRQWVDERNAQAEAGGSSWVVARREAGDAICDDNVRLSTQNIDFESFLHGLAYRPRDADDRDLNRLVRQIEAPVYLSGAWQDEQTGALFASMLDRFQDSEDARFLLYNGRHPDGFSPNNAYRWFEFLELYVAERVPELPLFLRTSLGTEAFAGEFGISDFEFPPDRFAGLSYDEALAAYRSEDPVTVVFESGAGGADVGTPIGRWEQTTTRWPPDEAVPTELWFGAGGALGELAGAGADRWTHDPDAGSDTFFGDAGYQLMEPLWDIDWRPFAAGHVASYVSAPFDEDAILAGPGIATLWVRSPADAVHVQVTLTEVRPDGFEVLVQSGWLDLGHRAAVEGDDRRLQRSYSKEAWQPVPVDTWIEAQVAIPSFAHPMRAGSRLRVAVSSPGRNHGTWEFEPPAYEGTPTFDLGWGTEHPSRVRLAVLPGAVAEGLPPCPSLRGQPCRVYEPVDNVPG